MFRRITSLHPQIFLLFPLWITIVIIHGSLDILFLSRVLSFIFLGISFWLVFQEFRIFLDALSSMLFTTLSFVTSLSFIGGLILFFGKWNSFSLAILLLIPFFIFLNIHFCFHTREEKKYEETNIAPKTPLKIFIPMLFSFFILLGINIWFIMVAQTYEATNSPWNLISQNFFLSFFLQSLFLLVISFKFAPQKWILFLQSLHILFIGTLALILFPLGYGFDPFVHQAAMNHIMENGFIAPKTPYYQGYYALVLFFSDLFSLSVVWVDRLFLPIVAAFSLPIALWSAFKKTRFSFLIFSFLLTLPFPLFINTTPQSVASFLLLLLIFQLISPSQQLMPKKLRLLFFLLITLSIFAIHPLSGIAALVIITVFFFHPPLQRILLLFEMFLAPAMFFSLEYIHNGKISWVMKFQNPFLPLFSNGNQEFRFFENLLHIETKYAILGIFFTIFLGFLAGFLRKKILAQKCLLVSGVIFLNGLFTFWFIQFSDLISYEQNAFSLRLFEMALYPLLPLVFFTLLMFTKKIKEKKILIPAGCLIAFLGVSALYASFPKNDRFEKSKLYNFSQSDKEAITWIKKNSANEPYIVLANQITSAGALEKFGFERTYNGQYFYSIPTSNPLYSIYLEMAEGIPNKESIQKARELMNTDTVYMIFNSYWTNFDSQQEKISEIARKKIEIDNGKTIIFQF